MGENKTLILIDFILLVSVIFASMIIQFNSNKIDSYNEELIQGQNELFYLSGLISSEYHKIIIANQDGNLDSKIDALGNLNRYVADYNELKNEKIISPMKNPPLCFTIKCSNLNNFLYSIQVLGIFFLIIIHSTRLKQTPKK